MQVKAAVTLGYQQPFVIKDVEVAPPGKDEILVKIVATGVCHTDAVMRDNPGVVPSSRRPPKLSVLKSSQAEGWLLKQFSQWWQAA